MAIVLIVLQVGSAHAPDGYLWTAKSPMPTARFELAGAAIGGYFYALGGSGTMQQVYSVNERFDPSTDSWITRKPMPLGRVAFAAASLNGKLYVAGGIGTSQNCLNSLEEYDPASDTWTEKAPMSVARAGLGLVTMGGRLYAFAGHCIDSTHNVQALDVVEAYFPFDDRWMNQTAMPVAMNRISAVAVGDRAYIFGGEQPTVSRYDPFQNTWTRLNGLNTTTMDVVVYRAETVSPATSTVYMIGRVNSLAGGYSGNTTIEYDALTYTWTNRTANPFANEHAALIGLNGILYSIGGTGPAPGLQPLDKVEAYGRPSDQLPATPFNILLLALFVVALAVLVGVLGVWIIGRRHRGSRRKARTRSP